MLATTPYRYILVETAEDGIAAVTLNRPEKRNALSLDVMRELIAAFEAIGADRAVKVVILRGLGPAFSAGHDLREMLQEDAQELGCVKEVEYVRTILERGTSAHRQLRTYEEARAAGASDREALVAVVDFLIRETAAGLTQ